MIDKSTTILLSEIKNYKLLDSNKQKELIRKYKNENDLKAREQLLRCNMRFVTKVAFEYQKKNNNISLGELINEGAVGLLKAIDLFNEDKKVVFITYAVWWIRANITKYISENNFIRIPHNIQRDISKELKKYPDKENLPKELKEKMLLKEKCYSLDSSIDGNSTTTFKEGLIDKNKDIEEYDDEQTISNLLQKSLNVLSPEERRVVKSVFGIDQDANYINQICEDMEESKPMIDYLLDLAMNKMKNSSSGHKLKDYLQKN